MEQQSEYYKEGYYIDYMRFGYEANVYEITKKEGKILQLRDPNSNRYSQSQRVTIPSSNLFPFRVKSTPKEETGTPSFRIFQIKTDGVEQNLQKLTLFMMLISENKLDELYSQHSTIDIMQFLAGHNYYQILRLFASCFKSLAEKQLLFRYLRTFLKFVSVYWPIIDLTHLDTKNIYCTHFNALMFSSTFIMSSLQIIMFSRHTYSLFQQNASLIKYEQYFQLLKNWFIDEMSPALLSKGLDGLNVFICGRLFKVLSFMMKNVKGLTLSQVDVKYTITLLDYIMNRLNEFAKKQLEQINNTVLELSVLIKKQIKELQLEKYKAKLKVSMFVVKTTVSKQAIDVLQDLRNLKPFFDRNDPEIIKQLITFPNLDKVISKFCAILSTSQQLSPAFYDHVNCFKKFMSKTVLESVITNRKAELFKKLSPLQIHELKIASQLLRANKQKVKQDLIIGVEIIRVFTNKKDYLSKMEKARKDKVNQAINSFNRSKQLLMELEEKQGDGQLNTALLSQEKEKLGYCQQRLIVVQQELEEVQKNLSLLADTQPEIEQLIVYIVGIAEEMISSDVNSPIITQIISLIIKSKWKVMEEYTKVAIEDHDINFFREAHIIRNYLTNFSISFEQARRLKKFENEEKESEYTAQAIKLFQKLCNNMTKPKTKQLLEARRQNLSLLLQLSLSYFPHEYCNLVIYYLDTLNKIESKDFKIKSTDFLMEAFRKEAMFPKNCPTEHRIKEIKRVMENMTVDAQNTFKLYQVLFVQVNIKCGNIIEDYFDINSLKFEEHACNLQGLDKLERAVECSQKTVFKKTVIDFLFSLLQGSKKILKQKLSIEFAQLMIKELHKFIQTQMTDAKLEYESYICQKLIKLLEIQNVIIKESYDHQGSQTIQNLEHHLGPLCAQIDFVDPDKEETIHQYKTIVKKDQMVGYLKFLSCKSFGSYPCQYDLKFGDEVITGKTLFKRISAFYTEQLQTWMNREKTHEDILQTIQQRRKYSTIIFKMVPNQQKSRVGQIIMKNLDIFFLNLPHTRVLWERLPIVDEQWFRNERLIQIRQIFMNYHESEEIQKRRVWDTLVDCDAKKMILLQVLMHQPDISQFKIGCLMDCLCPVSNSISIKINTQIFNNMKNFDYKLSEEDAMKILQILQIESSTPIQAAKLENSPEYVKYLYTAAGFILENTPFDAFTFFIKMKEGYYKDIENVPNLQKQVIQLWKVLYERKEGLQKLAFYEASIQQDIARYSYNYQVFLRILMETDLSQQIELSSQILSKFVHRISEDSFREEKKLTIKIFLRFVSIFLEKGIRCDELRNQKFIGFLQNNSCDIIGIFALEVLGYLVEIYPELHQKYAGQLIDHLSEPFWENKQSIKSTNNKINLILERKTTYLGLKNPHSICYMNSLFQQLYWIQKFRNGLFQAKWTPHPDKREDVMYQLKKIFVNLNKRQDQPYLNMDFLNAFKNEDGEPTQYTIQMDVDEFRNILFDRIQSSIILQNKEKGIKIEPTNFVQQVFNGKMKTIIQGEECHHTSAREEQFSSICLDVKGIHGLEQSLVKYFKPQILEGQNSYFCQECKKKVKASKRMQIQRYPEYLTFVLKRFEYMGTYRQKINSRFEYPIGQFQMVGGVKYKLVGIIIHTGISEAGHYFSLIKLQENKWYEFNDIFVGEISEQDVKAIGYGQNRPSNKNAYLLLYEKVLEQAFPHHKQPENIIFEGMQEEIIEIEKWNSTNKKANIFFSDEFGEFIKKICKVKKNRESFHLLFEYLAMIKVRMYGGGGDLNELNYLFELLGDLASGEMISSEKEVFWARQIMKNSYFLSPYKAAFSEVLVNNYQTLNQSILNFLKFLIATLGQNCDPSSYYKLLLLFAKKDNQILLYLIQEHIILRILYQCLPSDYLTPMTLREIQSISKQNPDVIPFRQKKDGEVQIYKYHKWKLVNYILESGHQINMIENQLINDIPMSVRKVKVLFREGTSKASINQLSRFICLLCNKKENTTRGCLQVLAEIVWSQRNEGLRKYLKVLSDLLKIDDQFKQIRITQIKNIFSKGLKSFNDQRNFLNFDVLWQWLLKIASKNIQFRERLIIFAHEFDIITKDSVKNCLYNFRTDAYYKIQEKSKYKYHRIHFPSSSQQNAHFYKQKINKTKQIFSPDHSTQQFGIRGWDSDGDLTEQPLQKGTIIKIFHKTGQFKQARIEKKCGDMLEINTGGSRLERYQRGDQNLTKYFQQDVPSSQTDLNNSDNDEERRH